MNIFEILLLLLPTAVHAIVDYRGIVIHWFNAMYVFAISIAVGIVLPGFWWQGAFFALCIHASLFDPIYNLMHKHRWNYHGDPDNPGRAVTDKLWSYLGQAPQGEIFIRLWILGVGYAIFAQLDLIFEYAPW